MKVLTFCSYYEPEIAASMYLTLNIMEAFSDKGLEVELYAPTPTRGVSNETIRKYSKIKKELQFNNRVIVHRFSMFQEKKSTIQRFFRYILSNLIFVIKGMATKADVLFIDSTPPTQGIMAVILKKKFLIP